MHEGYKTALISHLKIRYVTETHQQNKENKEHISDKVDRPENSVRLVDGIEIEVSENYSELCEAVGKK